MVQPYWLRLPRTSINYLHFNMAKKRFTFADAKDKIQELEMLLEDASLNQNDNIYDKGEQKFIKIYQYGFFILLAFNILYFILK